MKNDLERRLGSYSMVSPRPILNAIDSMLGPFGSRRLASILVVFPLICLCSSPSAAEPPKSNTPLHAGLREEKLDLKSRPTGFLEKWWPAYPESIAMFAEILAGNQLSMESGWYKKGGSRTRFNWEKICELFDSNHDKKITRNEFPGSDLEFMRLDISRNGQLSAFNLDLTTRDTDAAHRAEEFSVPAFDFADRNHDGKVMTRELDLFLSRAQIPAAFDAIVMSVKKELETRGKLAEDAGLEFVSLADFQAAFDLAARRGTLPRRPDLYVRHELVPRETLLQSFLRQEIGNWGSGPDLESVAPDFTLDSCDGKSSVTLSKIVGRKPLVLVFGNFSCGPFRSHSSSLYVLTQRYRELANFVAVYTRESHPIGGWELPDNQRAGAVFAQPGDYNSRADLARLCRSKLELDMPMVVDTMNDAVTRMYSGMPSRLYLIDRNGKIAYKGGRGPFGFKPEELEQSLILLLQTPGVHTPRPVDHATD
jgi:hypothetical protein